MKVWPWSLTRAKSEQIIDERAHASRRRQYRSSVFLISTFVSFPLEFFNSSANDDIADAALRSGEAWRRNLQTPNTALEFGSGSF